MAEMKTFNGYEVVDAKARQSIAEIQQKGVDLSDYYNKAETNAAIEEAINGIEIPETDISGKADLVHQHSMADITDYVEPDLSAYAKKTDIPTDLSDLNNNVGFLVGIPEEYITETELNNKGYITEHQSLAGLATEKYVDEAISNAAIGDVDLSNYYTKQEINTEIAQILSTLTQHNSSIQALEEAFDNIATAEGGSY